MDKQEDTKTRAIEAIINGDYDTASDIIINGVIEELEGKGFTKEEIMGLIGIKLEIGAMLDEL